MLADALGFLLALALVAGGPSAPAALAAPVSQANDNDDGDDSAALDAFVAETTVALNAYWGGLFQASGKEYVAPTLVEAASDERVNSRCFRSRGVSHSYCPADRTVYLDYDSDSDISLATLWADDRALVTVSIMAHEWGHHIQNQLGLFTDDQANPRSSVDVELQADCLDGLFVRTYARAVDWVEKADLKDTLDLTREVGDAPGTPMNKMTHGTPDQRVAAFTTGYGAKNLAACGL